MKNLNKFLAILIMIPFLSLVSANGIQVFQGNSTIQNLNINKTAGIDKTIQLTIENQEPFEFYNIHFEKDIIKMNPINLSSGENKTITAIIKTNEDYNGTLIIRGEYETTIGQSNKTYKVNIDYDNGIDICNLDLIIGDSINWKNNVSDEIDLKNVDNGNIIHTIPKGENYSRIFTTPIEFTYQATRLTIPFTQNCKIVVKNDKGLVHSQKYDFSFNTNIKISYEPTEISTTFLSDSYNISYNEEKQDIFSIKNNGSKIAKKIHLSGDWISFSKNDFDLNVGESTNLGFTIKPLIFKTEDTNKTYTKQIKIEGNFETKIQNISIFVPYQQIANQFNNGTFDPEFMRNLYNFYCSKIPTDPICVKSFSNSSNKGINVTYSAEFMKELFDKLIKLQDNFEFLSKSTLESVDNVSNRLALIDLRLNSTNDKISDTNKNTENLTTTILFITSLGLFLIFIFFIYQLWRKEGLRSRINIGAKFHKGEFSY